MQSSVYVGTITPYSTTSQQTVGKSGAPTEGVTGFGCHGVANSNQVERP